MSAGAGARLVQADAAVGAVTADDMAVVVVLTVVLPATFVAPVVRAAFGERRVPATWTRVGRAPRRRRDVAEPTVLSIAGSSTGCLGSSNPAQDNELAFAEQQPQEHTNSRPPWQFAEDPPERDRVAGADNADGGGAGGARAPASRRSRQMRQSHGGHVSINRRASSGPRAHRLDASAPAQAVTPRPGRSARCRRRFGGAVSRSSRHLPNLRVRHAF